MFNTGGGIQLATFTKESGMAKVAILGAGFKTAVNKNK